MSSKKFDFIIVGGGVNGLLTAYALSKNNFKVALLDSKNIEESVRKRIDGRGIAISKSTRDFMDGLNLWSQLESHAGIIQKIYVQDYQSNEHLYFDSADIFEDRLGSLIEMDDLHLEIFKVVKQEKLIHLFSNSKVISIQENADNVSLHTVTENLTAKLLIACDGKNSFIRDYLGISNYEHSYDQIAVVANIKHDNSHENTAYEFFQPNGPLAVLPRKNVNESSVVWVENSKAKDCFEDLDQEYLLGILDDKLGSFFTNIRLVSELNFYPLFLKLSKKYYSKKTIFIGDSLHHIHPVAGQGLNLCVKDIKILVELINKYHSYGQLYNNKMLFDEFFKARVVSNISMVSITHGLNKIFSSKKKSVKFIRNFGLGLVNKSKYIKSRLMRYAMGDNIDV